MKNITIDLIKKTLIRRNINFYEQGFSLKLKNLAYAPRIGLKVIRIAEGNDFLKTGKIIRVDKFGHPFSIVVEGCSPFNNDPYKYIPLSWIYPLGGKPKWF